MDHISYVQADPDFYRPLYEAKDLGQSYEARCVPLSWDRKQMFFWSVYKPPKTTIATHGWKVHVSADLSRAQEVLDIAAAVCVRQNIAFKHLGTRAYFLMLHHKHAPRSQNGKFIAAYPPDEEASRRLMEELHAALPGETGPYILGDRRWRDSRVVSYRYGAFETIPVIQPDGSEQLMVPDGSGKLVPDVRGLSFTLPEGIEDPFAAQTRPLRHHTATSAPKPRSVSFEGIVFDRLLRHSNGGGAYLATVQETGEKVFVKEARAHSGLYPDGTSSPDHLAHENRILRALDTRVPGVAPRPVKFFRRWEHTYLVTELVRGVSLLEWVTNYHPMFTVSPDREYYQAYWDRCARIVEQVSESLERLHEAGFVFLDVSPRNVLVDDDDTARLIDFETAEEIGNPLSLFGTPGYFPTLPAGELDEVMRKDPTYCDRYGLAALARLLTFGMKTHVIQREPAALDHLGDLMHRDSGMPVPDVLRRKATEFIPVGAPTKLPSPDEVRSDPLDSLGRLRDATADAILAAATPEGRVVFPTVPRAYYAHPHAVVYGTAGVLHALRLAGRDVPDEVLSRFRREGLEGGATAAPGLHSGSAGIAWVLADHGMVEEANALLAEAERHPILTRVATLGEGAAGVALTHLALYGHDRDEAHLDAARRIRASIPSGLDISGSLETEGATGLLHGRVGIALLDHYLYTLLGDEEAKRNGLALLREEAAQADPYPGGGIGFRVSAEDQRLYPYLYRGSAGFASVAARYLPVADEDLARSVDEAMRATTIASTYYAGLYEGQSGLVFALCEHASLTGSATSRAAALKTAQALFCHAVSGGTGAHFHGEYLMRFSTELWSGSAGVLLALTRLLDDTQDAFFTLDGLTT
ncbi:class III lanthionine synthetase LanKC [Streptomyces sudanensis]|uniref:class III lanthionine synthetase LanKC n=1 Tax=Streptomyces sudanensis TaxID=436397 RepID=UPI0020CD6E42|nr:class III lanthionine synthetase LanKC [Streptomyces sudanensis]MCP9958828.1 class III lanthionine synthetase LanKC [Streptomyces sudanensis]MCQ0000692.1 class III lanthionine synthetase LanKC [Streptomyces sudanensis]